MNFRKRLQQQSVYWYGAMAVMVLFAVFQLATINQYGVSWDEKDEHLLANALMQYIETGNVSEITLTGYPDLRHYGSSTPFLMMLCSVVSRQFLGLNVASANHLYIVLLGVVTLVATYLWSRRVFGKRVALWSILFLALFPQFIAHAQYNPKDIPQTAYIALTYYFFYRCYHDRKFIFALLAGVVYGIALSTVVSVLIALPIFFGSYVLFILFQDPVYRRADWKQYLGKDAVLFLVFAATAALTMYATWPLMWTEPTIFMDAVRLFQHHDWNGTVLYLGTVSYAAELPWHYAPLYLFIVTPLSTIIFFVFGLVYAGKQVFKRVHLSAAHQEMTGTVTVHLTAVFRYGSLLLWALIPLAVFMLPGAVNYDGIRHFFMAIPPLMILAGIGLHAVIERLASLSVPYKRVLPIAIICVFLFSIGAQIVQIHPYEGSYMNEIVRTVIPKHVEDFFEVEYWGPSYREGVKWLNANASQKSRVCIPFAPHLIDAYHTRKDLSFGCDQPYSYVMYFTRGGKRNTPQELTDHVDQARLVYTISRQGADYLYIYETK
ncbi:MAG: glycosyltransferase family 39 protein [Candidatus Kerfeldbacteria bacterium]|nr:glycosyltransferase family 39 protein [Candidatus Kerfeldbacteria bacterium]